MNQDAERDRRSNSWWPSETLNPASSRVDKWIQHPSEGLSSEEAMPFKIQIARSNQQLERAVGVRADAYGRKYPNLLGPLSAPEPEDTARGTVVFVAESKDPVPIGVGTLRVQTNQHGRLPIRVVHPEVARIESETACLVTRFAVTKVGYGAVVKLGLFKALYLYCHAIQIKTIVVAADPPLDRQYFRLGFKDVIEGGPLLTLPSWSFNHPLRLLALDVPSLERQWRDSHHSLYKMFFERYDPDIEIFRSLNGQWTLPRSPAQQ